MFELPLSLILIIIVALLFDFTNGWNDSANAIATVVSTRVLSPIMAVFLAASLNVAGAFLSTRVAKTVGAGLVHVDVVTPATILAAMIAATGWNGFMTVIGLPVSGSHSLIGGLLGAAFATAGFSAIQVHGILKVLTGLLISPILGLVAGFVLMVALMWIFRRSAPSILNRRFGFVQIGSAGMMALSHGTNDAQKVMGIITLALMTGGIQQTSDVPFWVILTCGLVIGLGTAFGGWGVIKTLGHGLMKLQPIHGSAAETASVLVLMTAAALGIPVSTTHTITASIIGVGSAKKFSAVRWGLGGKITLAWIFTFPCTMVVAAFFTKLLQTAGL